MAKTWRWVGAAAAAVAIFLVLLVWPASLGGTTSFVSTVGSSMEPAIHQGDLVLVRERAHYRVGDVVAYRSGTLGATVLHRIVDEDAQGFITKGDNNDFLDPDRISPGAILGRHWIQVPGGARLMGALKLGVPLIAGGIYFFRMGSVKRRRGRRPGHAAPAPPRAASSLRSWRTATIGAGSGMLLCAMIGVVAFGRPASDTVSTRLDYQQRGTFSYGATAPDGPVYSDGRVETGDPLFLQLVDELDVVFEYDFESAGAQVLKGTIAVEAVLSNASGWRHAIPLQAPTSFEDDDIRAEVRLDVREFQAIVDEVASSTGIKSPVATIAVVPDVTIEGTLDGRPIQEQFAPRLDFTLDAMQLRPTEVGDAAEELLAPVKAGALTSASQTPRHFVFLSQSVPVKTARTLAIGLGLPLFGVAAMGAVNLQRRLGGEAERIELRHGHRIVPVESKVADVIEVRSIQDLARMAEQYQSLILHKESDAGGHEYQMRADGVVYRYRTKDEKPAPSRLLG